MSEERESVILMEHWEQPSEGQSAWVVALTKKEVEELEICLAWFEDQAGDDYGDTIARIELADTKATGGDRIGMKAVCELLGSEQRYTTGEEIWGKDNPIMMKYGVKRS